MKIGLKESIIILFIMFALALFTIYGRARSTNASKEKDMAEASIVDNSTDFYDVSGIIDKYVSSLVEKSSENIILMLDEKYKKENKINKKNLYKFVGDFSDNIYSFVPIKMYYYSIDDTKTKFYVHGHLELETIDYNTDYKEFYVCVIVDKTNNIFSIIPDDGSIFKEVEE